ncbi:hypothetical protein FP828_08200, partial [bacterium]|nr:hypothetical protein [bacterium]
MKILLKLIALAAVAVLAFFAFFPFKIMTSKIASAVSEKIAASGADISWGEIESDFFRTVALSDVTVNTHREELKALNFKKVTLYFPVFFAARKGVSPLKIVLEGTEITSSSGELVRLFKEPGKAVTAPSLPPVFLRDVRVILNDIKRTFRFNASLDNDHFRVHVRSRQFSASARAAREKSDLWKINCDVKNMDFFSVFLSTPLLSGANFTGNIKTVFSSGKLKDTEITGVVSAERVLFPGISFPPGRPLEIQNFKSVLAVSKGTAEFFSVAGDCGALQLKGGAKITSLYNEPLADGVFKISGEFDSGDIRFAGTDVSVSIKGFLNNPVFRIKGSAGKFIKDSLELQNLSADASYNDRNSGCFSIESFDGKWGDFDIGGSGRVKDGALFIKGSVTGFFERGKNSLKIDAPYELGKNFKAYPEIEAVLYGRKLIVNGDVSYGLVAGTADVKLADSAGNNVFNAKLIKKNGDFVITRALFLIPEGSSVLTNGVIKRGAGGFSFDSAFESSLSFFEDKGKCSLSYSGGVIDAVISGSGVFLKYRQSSEKSKISFSLSGKSASGEFNVSGKYAGDDLKGSVSAGNFKTDFRVAGGSVSLTGMSYGKYAAGELMLSQSISGNLFVKDFPLKINALETDDKISARVDIEEGAFNAEVAGRNFSKKISGMVRSEGFSALTVSIPDKDFISGDFTLLMSGSRAKELIISRALIRAGGGSAEFQDLILDIAKRSGGGRIQIRNIKKGFANIFANSTFEIDYSSGVRIRGKADDVFINAFYMPFEYDVLTSGGKTVFSRPNLSANGVEGVLSESSGALNIFTGGSSISARLMPGGGWNLKTEKFDIQNIFKLFNADIEAFGSTKMELTASPKNYKLSFDAPRIYIGTVISARGSVSFDGDFIYPDVRIDADEGCLQTSGYIAVAASQVNKFSILANNLKISRIQTSFGEVRNFSASGEIIGGGTYEMPGISGKIISAFRVKHNSYPETVDFSLDARASGGKIIMSSTGVVKGVNFKLTGDALLGSGGLKNY